VKFILAFLMSTIAIGEECNLLTKRMHAIYRGEELYNNVEYVHHEDLHKYEITIKDNKFYNYKDKLVTTRSGIFRFRKDWAIFIQSPDEKIYMSEFYKADTFHHSSFLRGSEVAMAGRIVIEKGKVVEVTRQSGHYHPTKHMFHNFILFLDKHNLFK